MKKVKVTTTLKMEVQGEAIPSIEENPIKYFRKWFDDSLSYRNITSTEKQAD